MRDISPAPPREAALIDAAEFARLLSVSKPTLWRLRDSGKLPLATALTAQILRWHLRTGNPATGVLDWINAGCPPIGASDNQKESEAARPC